MIDIKIKRVSHFIKENYTINDILESLGVGQESLLDILDAEKTDLPTILDNDSDDIEIDLKEYSTDLDQLVKNNIFKSEMDRAGYVLSDIQDTDDFETFLINRLRYITVRTKDSNDLIDPDYLIIQSFNNTTGTWSKISYYKINKDFNSFYDRLSSRTIKLIKGDDTFIYKTSIKNEWELSNRKETDLFPRFIRNDELINILNSDKTITVKYI